MTPPLKVDQQAAEPTPIHDALMLETFREQLRAWDAAWADGERAS